LKNKNSVSVTKKITQFEPVPESINENITSVQENESQKLIASSRIIETIETMNYNKDYNESRN
jgi:hypothetical protein